MERGDLERAESCIAAAVNSYHRSIDVRLYCEILQMQNRWEEAVQQYQALLKSESADEDRVYAFKQLAAIYHSIERHDEATQFEIALREIEA